LAVDPKQIAEMCRLCDQNFSDISYNTLFYNLLVKLSGFQLFATSKQSVKRYVNKSYSTWFIFVCKMRKKSSNRNLIFPRETVTCLDIKLHITVSFIMY